MSTTDRKWEALIQNLEFSRRDFVFSSLAAGALTLAPLLSGYLAFHHLLLPYTLMLALHILSVELLLVFMPFTKLFHTVSLFIARWYNGDALGHKGARL